MGQYLQIGWGPGIKGRIFFRVPHPAFPMVLFLPFSLVLLGLAYWIQPYSWYAGLSIFLLGAFSWTLVEYFLHRYVFHWNPPKEPWRTLASGLHMAHHREPDNKSLIVAPPMVSLIFATVIFFIFLLMTWSWSISLILIAGLFVGYIVYEWVHYGAHHFNPKSKLGKYLKSYHFTHHFKHPNEVFGVTSPFWDYIFRTHR